MSYSLWSITQHKIYLTLLTQGRHFGYFQTVDLTNKLLPANKLISLIHFCISKHIQIISKLFTLPVKLYLCAFLLVQLCISVVL